MIAKPALADLFPPHGNLFQPHGTGEFDGSPNAAQKSEIHIIKQIYLYVNLYQIDTVKFNKSKNM